MAYQVVADEYVFVTELFAMPTRARIHDDGQHPESHRDAQLPLLLSATPPSVSAAENGRGEGASVGTFVSSS